MRKICVISLFYRYYRSLLEETRWLGCWLIYVCLQTSRVKKRGFYQPELPCVTGGSFVVQSSISISASLVLLARVMSAWWKCAPRNVHSNVTCQSVSLSKHVYIFLATIVLPIIFELFTKWETRTTSQTKRTGQKICDSRNTTAERYACTERESCRGSYTAGGRPHFFDKGENTFSFTLLDRLGPLSV